MNRYDEFAQEGWQCVGDDADRAAQLYKTIEIEGCPFHLNAIRIMEDHIAVDELQIPDPASGYTLEDFQKLSEVFRDSGPWNTIVVGSRQYVVWPEPYSSWVPSSQYGNVVPLRRPGERPKT